MTFFKTINKYLKYKFSYTNVNIETNWLKSLKAGNIMDHYEPIQKIGEGGYGKVILMK